MQNYLLTEQQQLDVLGGLNAVLLEVLLYLLAARPGCALLGAHGAAHDDGLEGAQGHGAAPIAHLEFELQNRRLTNRRVRIRVRIIAKGDGPLSEKKALVK